MIENELTKRDDHSPKVRSPEPRQTAIPTCPSTPRSEWSLFPAKIAAFGFTLAFGLAACYFETLIDAHEFSQIFACGTVTADPDLKIYKTPKPLGHRKIDRNVHSAIFLLCFVRLFRHFMPRSRAYNVRVPMAGTSHLTRNLLQQHGLRVFASCPTN